MTRALTLIRNYLIEDIKSTAAIWVDKDWNFADGSNGLQQLQKPCQPFLMEILFVSTTWLWKLKKRDTKRIQNTRSFVRRSGQYFEVQSRCFLHQPECRNIIKKVHGRKDLVQLCQNNISFFKRVIRREHGLFCQYFSGRLPCLWHITEGQLYEWYKDLLEPLYDTLRDRIIRACFNQSSACWWRYSKNTTVWRPGRKYGWLCSGFRGRFNCWVDQLWCPNWL